MVIVLCALLVVVHGYCFSCSLFAGIHLGDVWLMLMLIRISTRIIPKMIKININSLQWWLWWSWWLLWWLCRLFWWPWWS